MTIQEIFDLPDNKIASISVRISQFAKSTLLKVYKTTDFNTGKQIIVVVTKAGLDKYLGNAQHAYGWGMKNKDYRTFVKIGSAAEFIKQQTEHI